MSDERKRFTRIFVLRSDDFLDDMIRIAEGRKFHEGDQMIAFIFGYLHHDRVPCILCGTKLKSFYYGKALVLLTADDEPGPEVPALVGVVCKKCSRKDDEKLKNETHGIAVRAGYALMN